MPVDRTLPTPEAAALLELTRELADGELRPRVQRAERAAEFPREVLRTLGKAGLLGLPYPEALRRRRPAVRGVPAGGGGAGRPPGWPSGSGVSVHTLACYPIAAYGSDAQRDELLPDHARRRPAGRVLPVRARRAAPTRPR